MKKEELYIVLGCFGRRDDDFVSCASLENRILLIEPSLFRHAELLDYLDGCRLFDRPLFDYNAVRHVIFNLKDKFEQPTRPLWNEKKFNLYQKFTMDHRHCGLYIKLVLIAPELDEPIKEPDRILIPGTPDVDIDESKPHNLRVIRGRQK